MSQNKRLFVAINVSDLMVSNFQPFLKKLKIGADQREIDLRWTVPENYHVTLSFIGNRNITEIPEFYSALEEAAKSFPAFNLKMEDVSAFPNETAGRVIYVGVQAKKILQNLKAKIDQELMAANLIAEVEEFTFIPHLTIARLRNPQHVKDFLSPVKRKNFGKVQVKEIVLYESHLNGNFPVYVPIKRFPLTGEEAVEVTEFYEFNQI